MDSVCLVFVVGEPEGAAFVVVAVVVSDGRDGQPVVVRNSTLF